MRLRIAARSAAVGETYVDTQIHTNTRRQLSKRIAYDGMTDIDEYQRQMSSNRYWRLQQREQDMRGIGVLTTAGSMTVIVGAADAADAIAVIVGAAAVAVTMYNSVFVERKYRCATTKIHTFVHPFVLKSKYNPSQQ